MKKSRLLLVAISLVLVLVLALAACGEEETTPTPTPKPTPTPMPTPTPTEGVIKLGVTTPLSGPAAGWGTSHLRAFETVLEDINAQGGIDLVKEIKSVSLKL